MIDIKIASELPFDPRNRMGEIFADGFGKDLAFFTRDKNKLAAAVAHMFVLDVFYVALVDGEIAGMAACTNEKHRYSVEPGRKELIRHFGLYKGMIAGSAFKREFQKPFSHPGSKVASIEFVVTDTKFRGQGIATAILEHFFTLSQYEDYYIEEVADINTNALMLYKKLGYQEYARTKTNHADKTGINYMIALKCHKESRV